jgi:hypothetical protein
MLSRYIMSRRYIRRLGLLAAILASPCAAQEFRYRGTCDASAAVALGKDHFVVADDEADTLFVYRRGAPDPVSWVDLAAFLGNGAGKEADIEGAARIGERIYWIASHGRNSRGKVRETRWRFFAADRSESASGPSVKAVATPYAMLLSDIVAEGRRQDAAMSGNRAKLDFETASMLAPEEDGGFNIEGLAAGPNGHLLIGFRNPLSGGHAIVLPMTNPADVLKGTAAAFGKAMRIDLGQRGIRSIEQVGNGYLIVAGSYDDGSSFALYRWTGKDGDAPTLVPVALGALRPEALFEIPATKEIVLLSDDGSEKVDGKDCKDKSTPAAKKSFRALTLTLP